jgi:Cu(I)/Ag(I) efflux system protein CusF
MKKLALSGITALSIIALPSLALAEMVSGEVKKVDEAAQKITIKHGPIKSLDMDMTMTMVFKAADPALLKAAKPGDKIVFEPARVNGQFTVMKIEKAK